MNELHLFAGAGGGILGSELLGFRTVCAVDLNPIPQAYCSPDRMTAYSRLSRFGMTYEPLTDDRGAALLTWYLEASRARTFQPQEKAPALTAPAPASGGKCTELSMKYDRNSHSWKTHLCLWEEDLPESSVTLPASGMMLHGVCWELTPLDYPIAAPDYGFLPTMRACIAKYGLCWKLSLIHISEPTRP